MAAAEILQDIHAGEVELSIKRNHYMTLAELVRYIHTLNAELQMYERKYNILSQTFYESYQAGEEPPDDAWVLDWSDWAGVYELWIERQAQYQELLQKLHEQWPLNVVIEKATRHEPIAVAS